MKIIYVSAKLFIVLVKISLPLIQEIIMLILHVVNNALNSFTEKNPNTITIKCLMKKTYHIKHLTQRDVHVHNLPLLIVPSTY